MKKIQLVNKWIVAVCVLGLMLATAQAEEKKENVLRIDKQKVHAWNIYADKLYAIHNILLEQHEVRTESEPGGYAEQPNLYTETRYYDKQTNKLLSRVQRMNDNPELIHLIQNKILLLHI